MGMKCREEGSVTRSASRMEGTMGKIAVPVANKAKISMIMGQLFVESTGVIDKVCVVKMRSLGVELYDTHSCTHILIREV